MKLTDFIESSKYGRFMESYIWDEEFSTGLMNGFPNKEIEMDKKENSSC